MVFMTAVEEAFRQAGLALEVKGSHQAGLDPVLRRADAEEAVVHIEKHY